jgi:hypothetical protein
MPGVLGTTTAFPRFIDAAPQGSDDWDAEFIDKFIDTLVENVTLLAEEPAP